jgi:D-alanine-D-alanine ligase
MRVAVCFNTVPAVAGKGEAVDRISEEGAEAEALSVAAALRQRGHVAELIPLGEQIDSFIVGLRTFAPDVAFNLCEGFWGESRREMHVAALFDLLGVYRTGSPPLCLGLTQDKARTKDILLQHGLPTPKSALVRPGEKFPRVRGLDYPLFVKPRFEDASLGITSDSIVHNEKELLRRIAYIHATYRQGALVEEYIDGREFNVAIFGNNPAEVLPISEIRFAKGLDRPIVSYAGKWLEGSPEYTATEPICPARLSKKDELLIGHLALRAYRLLECRDYARVDIRMRDHIPYILEINANPDISPDAGLARSARVGGHSYPDLVEKIVGMAQKRKEAGHA